MEQDIQQIEHEILNRKGLYYTFTDVQFQVNGNVEWLEIITFKPIAILGGKYEYKNNSYMIPISDIDLYQSILLHILKSDQLYVNQITKSNNIISYYIIDNVSSLVSSVSYIPGKIIWLYKDNRVVMDDGDKDLYMNIINSLYNGYTTTQNLWKRHGIIMYSNIHM